MIEQLLIEKGKEYFERDKLDEIIFVENQEANKLLNDIDNYPHAFVLACLMDRQIKTEKAWVIPFHINEALGSFKMKDLLNVPENDYKKIFERYNLHRFNEKMASVFYKGIQRISCVYKNDASRIWKGMPSSAEVVYRLLEFDGVGIKIATMATNILSREFRVPFSDYYSIDLSPDSHVKRVLFRMGLVEADADDSKIIYKARMINPDFPGILDYPLWKIGREWCTSHKPNCKECEMSSECRYSKCL